MSRPGLFPAHPAPALVLASLLGLSALAAPRGDDELERLVRTLDSTREPEWSQALEELARRGSLAAERVLSDFAQADFPARRARAKLLVQIPDPAECPRVLALLDDPDPQVRRLFALYLGNLALASSSADERVAALERLARADPSDYVRAKAREALLESALPQAVAALDGLIDALPAEEAERAASALARLPSARERLLARVGAACSGGAPLADGVLAALFEGYGRDLAEVPKGGESVRERQPFLAGRLHADPAVAAAARSALASFVARAAELGEPERADLVLAHLAEEGWPPEECLKRRLDVAWYQRGAPAEALDLARLLARRARILPGANGAEWELHARFLEGAAEFALDDFAAADALFAGLVTRLEAARAARADLFPSPPGYREAGEFTRAGGERQADALTLLALAHEWRALLALANAASEASVLGELRGAHLAYLQARAVAIRSDAQDPGTLDGLFEHELGPHRLVLFNERLGAERRAPALERAVALARAWACVSPLELLGFEGAPSRGAARGLLDPFGDPQRLAAIGALRTAQKTEYNRRLNKLDRADGPRDEDMRRYRAQIWQISIRELEKSEEQEARELAGRDPGTLPLPELQRIFAHLADFLAPSMHAQALAGELRNEGHAAEARALAEHALATLRSAPGGASPVGAEWASARFELLVGATYMDEGKPKEAEQSILGAIKRLEAIESTVQEARDNSADGEDARQREAYVRSLREKRGDALLSLAVNANVRMGDPARALEYFERAYALNQSTNMRVLRACYRARSGKGEEARAVLRSITPTPSLYYNIACTHALLGEKDAALDFLERDFRENYPTPGAHARQREWARKDPDLASLRGEPRFERLLEGGS